VDWKPRAISPSHIALAGLAVVNAVLLAVTLLAFLYADIGADWTLIYSRLGDRLQDGSLYEWSAFPYAFRYSPVAAWIFAGLAPLGLAGWMALHFAALSLVGWRMAALALVSFPFWADVYNGNTTTFVFVTGLLALRGSLRAGLAFLALSLLIPRPMMVPLVGYLLWRTPSLRLPFAALFVVHAGLVVLSGYGDSWMAVLVRRSFDDVGGHMDIGPALLLGPWWLPLAVVAATLAMAARRVGLASVLICPYWLPYYLIPLLWEFDTHRAPARRPGPGWMSGRAATRRGDGHRRLAPSPVVGPTNRLP
jgi:hypothetical protein